MCSVKQNVFKNGAFPKPVRVLAVGFIVGAVASIFSNNMVTASVNKTITDESWVAMGQAQGVDGEVNDLASDKDGNLYVGGKFVTAGGIIVNNIAKWTGSKWEALGGGVNGIVYSIVISGNGNLYVAGRFDTAGISPVCCVAKWNGSEWSALGNGIPLLKAESMLLSIKPISIVVDRNDILYAGGDFWGGYAANHVALWNGTTWSALGIGSGQRSDLVSGYIFSLAVDTNGFLYAGGEFDTVGGVVAQNIAQWNGTKWNPLGSGLIGSGTEPLVKNLMVDKNNILHVEGGFQYAGGKKTPGLAKWDGNNWDVSGGGGLAIDSGGNCYSATISLISNPAESKTKITIRNITADKIIAELIELNTIKWINCMDVNNKGTLFIGGKFLLSGDSPARSIIQWNGSAMTVVGDERGKGLSGYVDGIKISSAGDIYACGGFVSGGEVPINNVALWKDGAWHSLENGLDVRIRTLAFDTIGSLFAAGCFEFSNSLNDKIKKWDGSNWSVAAGVLKDGMDIFSMVAVSSSMLYAGGQFGTLIPDTIRNIALWDSVAWKGLGKGIQGPVFKIEMDKTGSLYAAGVFDSAGGLPALNIAKWNGSTWSSLGGGLGTTGKMEGPDGVRALVFDQSGNLYAGGSFSTAGGVSVANIAKWDGIKWSSVGQGIMVSDTTDNYHPVRSLAFDSSGILYAGGDFDLAGNTAAHNIARWDGSTWSALGSGIDGGYETVDALAVDNNQNLYVGGSFSIAGGKVSPNFAICRLDGRGAVRFSPSVDRTSELSFELCKNHVRINLSKATVVRISLYSLSGRELRRNISQLPVGDHLIDPGATDFSGGLYVVKVESGRVSKSFKVVSGGAACWRKGR